MIYLLIGSSTRRTIAGYGVDGTLVLYLDNWIHHLDASFDAITLGLE
jgi:hypothetical protein